MQLSIVSMLRCPEGCGTLTLIPFSLAEDDCQEGALHCNNAHVFPVTNGIPRLFRGADLLHKEGLQDGLRSHPERLKQFEEKLNYSGELSPEIKHAQASFSAEWASFSENQAAWGQSREVRKALFLRCFNLQENQLEGKRLLEVGCGFGETVLGLENTGLEIFAVDLSSSVDLVKKRVSPERRQKVHFIQASVYNLPLQERAFDLVHSSGVLHHTPNTAKAFSQISKYVQSDGLCFIDVYSNDHKNLGEKIYFHTCNMIRKVTTRIPPQGVHLLTAVVAPLMLVYTKTFNLFAGRTHYRHRSFKELRLSLFDAFSPLFDWHHTTEKVLGWFKNQGYQDIKKTYHDQNLIGILGQRIQ